jgi:hypothetical protein
MDSERQPVRSAARLLAALLLPIVISSCGTTAASQKAQAVRVTSNPEAVRGCKYLGNVEGWSDTAFRSSGAAANNATVEMREKGAKLGANVILSVSTGEHAIGEAYLCANPNQ